MLCSSGCQRCVLRNERWVERPYPRIEIAPLRCHGDCVIKGNEGGCDPAVFGKIRCVAVDDELEEQHRKKKLLAIDVGRVVLWSGHSAQGSNPLSGVQQSSVQLCMGGQLILLISY